MSDDDTLLRAVSVKIINIESHWVEAIKDRTYWWNCRLQDGTMISVRCSESFAKQRLAGHTLSVNEYQSRKPKYKYWRFIDDKNI